MADLMSPLLDEVITVDGTVSADAFTAKLRMTKAEFANAVGLAPQAVSKTKRLHTVATQARLRDVAEIINRVMPWSGSLGQAFAWYRGQPLPSFGDLTPEDLVKQGRADAVKRYLSRIAEGGYA
ncbi:MAG: DUF2384 domain-containing protein [Proteobacteria bacterium]|nr:DUF2384 domain-containing protein [Pseudomonadota bacterium]